MSAPCCGIVESSADVSQHKITTWLDISAEVSHA
ncbi:hypothetical protein SLEP1_g49193 [Rubroshorea leprosula]|uniref:Uncharacterized protein n=1 Tax=Rubroshorea leprosula TaxID=152421 RepID=A0AAV5LY41_9ROSI|nr:hypothetical protein SLEP1_g49193 [Rubroshorea leprosula]